MDSFGLIEAFSTIVGTIFIAEMTDKDALLLLSLATKTKPLLAFAAGSIAFTITSAIIVSVGSALVVYVPIFWVKIAGGVVMLSYAVWQLKEGFAEEKRIETQSAQYAKSLRKGGLYTFLGMVASLALLDLAGDATELVTIIFVAQFRNILLVFSGAVAALVAASGVETILGNRLGRLLSAERIRYLSVVVFLTIGSAIILTSISSI